MTIFVDIGHIGDLVLAAHGQRDLVENLPVIADFRHKKIESLGFTTAGHRHFTLEGAKEFCQKIAAGEIDPEALLMEFAAEDDAKERAVFREITEKAKKFHAMLDAKGLKYRDLLELEVLAHSLGDMGHHILLGYERGEGWPSGT